MGALLHLFVRGEHARIRTTLKLTCFLAIELINMQRNNEKEK